MKQGNKIRTIALLSAASLLIGTGSAYAVTATVTAKIKFVNPITVSETSGPDFAMVNNAVGDTYVLDTADGLTAGTSSNIEGGTPKSGVYAITSSTTQAMNITVDTPVASAHATPSLPTCSWDGNGPAACGATDGFGGTASAASTTLKLGLTMTTTAGAVDGTVENPTMNINVVYQ